MGEVKRVNIKNRTYYFYNDFIDIKNFESKLLKIDKKPNKNIGIYNIGYMTIKKYLQCESFVFTYWSCEWVYWRKRCK